MSQHESQPTRTCSLPTVSVRKPHAKVTAAGGEGRRREVVSEVRGRGQTERCPSGGVGGRRFSRLPVIGRQRRRVLDRDLLTMSLEDPLRVPRHGHDRYTADRSCSSCTRGRSSSSVGQPLRGALLRISVIGPEYPPKPVDVPGLLGLLDAR